MANPQNVRELKTSRQRYDESIGVHRQVDDGLPRQSEDDALPDVAGHLPHVAGMSFLDVDHEKRDAVFVLLIHLVERGNLPAKWRSSVAPKNQNHRAVTAEAECPLTR